MGAFVTKPDGSAVKHWESEVRVQMQAMGGIVMSRIDHRYMQNADDIIFRSMDEMDMYEREGISTEVPIDDAQFGHNNVNYKAYATRVFTDKFEVNKVNFTELDKLAEEIVRASTKTMDRICFNGAVDGLTRIQDNGTSESDGIVHRRFPRRSIEWQADAGMKLGGTAHTADNDNFLSDYGYDSNVYHNYNSTLDHIWGNGDHDIKERFPGNPTHSGIFSPAKNVVPLGYFKGKNHLAVDAAGNAISGSAKTSSEDTKNALRLSYSKLIRLGNLLDNQNVPDGPRYLFVTPDQLEQLLHEKEVQSSDYNSIKALVSGAIDSWCGFTFVKVTPRRQGALRHRDINLDANQAAVLGMGSTARDIEVTDSICWVPRAVGGLTKTDFAHDVSWIPERISHQLVAWFEMGAYPVDLRGVFSVPTIKKLI